MAARRRRVWPLLLLGVLAYAIFLLVQFPAAVAHAFARGALSGAGVQLAGLSGSVWSGRAASAQIQGLPLGGVNWQLRVLPLLTGRAAGELSFRHDQGSGRTRFSAGNGNARLNDVEAQIPAAHVAPLVKAVPLTLGGTLVLRMQEIEMQADAPAKLVSASGRLVWQDAALGVANPRAYALGNLGADIETTTDGLRANLRDGGGPLEMDVQALLTPDARYRVTGRFGTRAEAEQELVTAIRFMGRPGPDGRVVVDLNGKL